MQGGLTLDELFRVGGGTGSQGNPGLLPYKSKNIDLSAEWYYGTESYLSVGYFHKDVSNFISTTRVDQTAFDLHTPVGGPRYQCGARGAWRGRDGGRDPRLYRDQLSGSDSRRCTTGYRAVSS